MASPAKVTNRIRIANCVMFIIEIFLLTETFFVLDLKGNGQPQSMTMFYSAYVAVNQEYNDVSQVSLLIRILLICLIPIVGFFVFSFDKTRNIKNIYGIIMSAVAVFLITTTIPSAQSIGLGAVLALLFYLPIVFLSVLGMFSRKNLINQSKRK